MPQIQILRRKITALLNNNLNNNYNNEEENGGLATVDQVLAVSPLPSSDATNTVESTDEDQAFIYQPEGHPKHALIDGETWPPIFKPEFVRSAKKMVPLKDDVFVVTYPKCGTTWIQHICSQLMAADYSPDVGKVSELYLTSPMIERMGAKFVSNLTQPRLLKTHFAYGNCPQSAHAKYIYAARNPKDCLNSYFHHNLNFKCYDWANGEFATFCQLFAEGRLGFGDYFDHLKSWLPHINDPNVLFLKYEDMCEDLESAVRKIGHFLGGRAAQIVDDAAMLERVVRESSLDAMKHNQSRFFNNAALRKENSFIRKGGSRDWKNHMTREQSDAIDALYRVRMTGTVAADWWKYEMCWDEEEAHQIAYAEDLLRASDDAAALKCDEEIRFSVTSPVDIRIISDASDASSSSSGVASPSTSASSRRGSFSSSSSSSSGATSRSMSPQRPLGAHRAVDGTSPASYLAMTLLSRRAGAKPTGRNSLTPSMDETLMSERRGSGVSIASSGYESTCSSTVSLNLS